MSESVYKSSTGAKGFITPDEFVVSSLKNGLYTSATSKSYDRRDVVVTNRHLYCSQRTGLFNLRSKEEIVALQDISSVSIKKSISWLLLPTWLFSAFIMFFIKSEFMLSLRGIVLDDYTAESDEVFFLKMALSLVIAIILFSCVLILKSEFILILMILRMREEVTIFSVRLCITTMLKLVLDTISSLRFVSS